MREAGVELELGHGEATGVAVILVDEQGENVIVVAPGANAQVGRVEIGGDVLSQLEVADETVVSARGERRALLPQRRAGPRDSGGGRALGRAGRRQPLRARLAAGDAAPAGADARRGGRRPDRGWA